MTTAVFNNNSQLVNFSNLIATGETSAEFSYAGLTFSRTDPSSPVFTATKEESRAIIQFLSDLGVTKSGLVETIDGVASNSVDVEIEKWFSVGLTSQSWRSNLVELEVYVNNHSMASGLFRYLNELNNSVSFSFANDQYTNLQHHDLKSGTPELKGKKASLYFPAGTGKLRNAFVDFGENNILLGDLIVLKAPLAPKAEVVRTTNNSIILKLSPLESGSVNLGFDQISKTRVLVTMINKENDAIINLEPIELSTLSSLFELSLSNGNNGVPTDFIGNGKTFKLFLNYENSASVGPSLAISDVIANNGPNAIAASMEVFPSLATGAFDNISVDVTTVETILMPLVTSYLEDQNGNTTPVQTTPGIVAVDGSVTFPTIIFENLGTAIGWFARIQAYSGEIPGVKKLAGPVNTYAAIGACVADLVPDSDGNAILEIVSAGEKFAAQVYYTYDGSEPDQQSTTTNVSMQGVVQGQIIQYSITAPLTMNQPLLRVMVRLVLATNSDIAGPSKELTPFLKNFVQTWDVNSTASSPSYVYADGKKEIVLSWTQQSLAPTGTTFFYVIKNSQSLYTIGDTPNSNFAATPLTAGADYMVYKNIRTNVQGFKSYSNPNGLSSLNNKQVTGQWSVELDAPAGNIALPDILRLDIQSQYKYVEFKNTPKLSAGYELDTSGNTAKLFISSDTLEESSSIAFIPTPETIQTLDFSSLSGFFEGGKRYKIHLVMQWDDESGDSVQVEAASPYTEPYVQQLIEQDLTLSLGRKFKNLSININRHNAPATLVYFVVTKAGTIFSDAIVNPDRNVNLSFPNQLQDASVVLTNSQGAIRKLYPSST